MKHESASVLSDLASSIASRFPLHSAESTVATISQPFHLADSFQLQGTLRGKLKACQMARRSSSASWSSASNYSFKPRPLRGSANAVSCTTTPRRYAVRLNSGVRAHMKDLWFGLFMLSLGVGMLIWTQKDFVGLVRRTGRLSMWAGLLPSTRVGLTAVSLFAVLAGISVLVPLNKSSGVGNVVSIVLIVLLFGGLIHDLVSWLWQHFKRGGGEP